MATNYQYKSIKIRNFRSFHEMDIPSLRRINIFGGFNGIGKTSLLETFFFTMDVGNPIAIFKPFFWRGTIARDEDDLFFLLTDRKNVAQIESNGARGPVNISISIQPTPNEALSARNANSQNFQREMRTSESYGRQGLQIEARWAEHQIKNFIFPDAEGYSGATLHSTNPQIPQSVIVGNNAKSSPNETATRLSKIIKARRIESVITPLKMFQPTLSDFKILQYGPEQAIFANLDGDLYPVNMLGEGFKNLFEVILAISVAKNGCVFLDEVDSSFHYSIVADAWNVISKAAVSENCQIFASSHSRETIESAAKGVRSAGNEKDFSYYRIARVENKHVCTNYTIDELASAEEFSIEIR